MNDKLKQALELDAEKRADIYAPEYESMKHEVSTLPHSYLMNQARGAFKSGGAKDRERVLMLAEALQYISKRPRYPGYDDSQSEAEMVLAKLYAQIGVANG